MGSQGMLQMARLTLSLEDKVLAVYEALSMHQDADLPESGLWR